MNEPWKKWIPGVLNPQQMKELCDNNIILSEGSLKVGKSDSSFDLTLSNECYQMVQGSVKPSSPESYGMVHYTKRTG